MVLIIIFHVVICIGLMGLVLIQRGRGAGLVESFQGVESMFGTKTSAFLTRTTTILSILFFITCLSLALLSIRQSRSLLRDIKPKEAVKQAVSEPAKAPVTQQGVQEAAPTPEPASGNAQGALPKTE